MDAGLGTGLEAEDLPKGDGKEPVGAAKDTESIAQGTGGRAREQSGGWYSFLLYHDGRGGVKPARFGLRLVHHIDDEARKKSPPNSCTAYGQ